jgi:Zn finger protein HypA/HybF involved in hydrogenase expression
VAEVVEDRSRVNDNYPCELSCERCKSKVRVDLSDLEFGRWKVGGYWFAGTEIIEDKFTWECPACGHQSNEVDRDSIPVGTRDDLVAAYREKKASGAPII